MTGIGDKGCGQTGGNGLCVSTAQGVLVLDEQGHLGSADAVSPVGLETFRIMVEGIAQCVGKSVTCLSRQFAGGHFEILAAQGVDVKLGGVIARYGRDGVGGGGFDLDDRQISGFVFCLFGSAVGPFSVGVDSAFSDSF